MKVDSCSEAEVKSEFGCFVMPDKAAARCERPAYRLTGTTVNNTTSLLLLVLLHAAAASAQ
jgi:hypothetical protein